MSRTANTCPTSNKNTTTPTPAPHPQKHQSTKYPYTNAWLAYIAEAAHGVDTHYYTRTVQDADLGDRRTVLRYAHGILGLVWHEIYAYSQYDPETLRTGTDMTAWEADLPQNQALMDNLCAACPSATFLRDFTSQSDKSAFKSDLDAGNLSWIDRSARPWQPGDLAAPVDFENVLKVEYDKALLYYDTHVVGALQVGTPHL